MRRLLTQTGLIALLALGAVPASAHEDPPGCTTSSPLTSFASSSDLAIIHRNGDPLEIAVRAGNNVNPNVCSFTDVDVTVQLPAPDGTPGPITTVATDLDLPAGTAPFTLTKMVPYDVNLNPGVFSAPIKVADSGTGHFPGGDTVTGGSLTTNVIISRPQATINVTPTPASGPAPFNTTYNYSVTNTSPVNPAQPTLTPDLIAPTNDRAILSDDTCSPLTFTGGDTINPSQDPPQLDDTETWTFTCIHLFGAPGTFTNTVSILGGSNRDGRPWPATTDQSTVTATGPDVAVAKSHDGDFVRGDLGRSYQLTARNAGNEPTSGTVTLADQLPAGLSATGISGTGWSCAVATLMCTCSDTLAGGASYPPVILTVDVAADAPSQVVNEATVAGGGEPGGAGANNSASDPTTIVPIARPPSGNAFDIARAKSGRGGKVVLTVEVPGAGSLEADDAGKADLLKTARRGAEGAGFVKLTLRPTRKAKRKLQRGKAVKATVEVKFAPAEGDPVAKRKKVKLRPAKK